jgi:hypothetical protein
MCIYIYHRHTIKHGYNDAFSLTLRDKVSPQLMKLYYHIIELADGTAWFVIMLSKMVLQYTNGFASVH